jgi:hypothetical protein
MEAGKERLTCDTAQDASRSEVEGIKQENARLKQLVAELSCRKRKKVKSKTLEARRDYNISIRKQSKTQSAVYYLEV